MATGRIAHIKKTYILRAAAVLFFVAFVAYVFVCIFVLKNPALWFYGFCLFLGIFELAKSALFKFDSSLFLGALLVLIGSFCFIFTFTNTANYAAFYIASAFSLACAFTFVFTRQNFHLVIAFSITFVQIYALLLVKNLISTPIFVAFVVPFLVLLLLEMIFICFHKK